MRHLGNADKMRIYPGYAITQAGHCLHCLRNILRPDRCGQAIGGIICPGDSCFDIVEAGRCHHWPENFLAHNRVILQRVCDQCRLIEKPVAAKRLATCHNLHMTATARAVDHRLHPVILGSGNNRAHLDTLILGLAGGNAGDGPGEIGNKIIVDLVGDVIAAGLRAILTGVIERKAFQLFNNSRNIGIVIDDHRRFAAQFQMRVLDCRRCGLKHLAGRAD